MANTYSQIYIQTVFAVKHREALIQKEWRDDLLGYATGILQNKGQKVLERVGKLNFVFVLNSSQHYVRIG